MFKPTLSETHGTTRLAARKKDELGKAVSTVVIIPSTANNTTNQPLHQINEITLGAPEEAKYIGIRGAIACHRESQIMKHRYTCQVHQLYQPSPRADPLELTRSPSPRIFATAGAANDKTLYHAPCDAS